MTETLKDNKPNIKSRIIQLSIGLWILQFIVAFMFSRESMKMFSAIILVFGVVPLIMILAGSLMRFRAKTSNDLSARQLNIFISLLCTAAIFSIAEISSSAILGGSISKIKLGILFYILTALALFFLLRGALIKVIYEIGKKAWDENAWKLASAYADGISIAIVAIAVAVYSRDVSYARLAILVLVCLAARITWGYVPEHKLLVMREFIDFLSERKLWWMTPIFIVLGLLTMLMIFTQTTGGSFAFIYPIF